MDQIIKGNKRPYAYGTWENKIVVMPDGFRLIFIEEFMFPFDLEKLNNSLTKSVLDGLLKNLDRYEDAELTKDKRDCKSGTAVKIANDRAEVYVNEKFLKVYGKGVTFKISKLDRPEIKPVLVYDELDLIGYVLPIRMK